ncbi:diguanylate cyclase (GGDEF) domain-containing protein [Oribacterium sp. KHPX15]|uniref:sensor domain-containing diguanylate cyclase n=1 Tax=Oribacterium sp. KHPX15 TaxID=1855342 RepID=UPI00089CE029|nr:EAL domain-containing protein [Oribacterium sp. KHPX15]SEA64518.1 diguanylate cyclase (GGDEF) domain-containing protein [Oribacterium sp. KHPX15]
MSMEKINEKINYDHLTGFPDMNRFFELAEDFFESNAGCGIGSAMLFMDLCGMKAFNQRYGYTEGDRLIREVANLLVKYFGKEGCCRTTADHFTVYTYSKDLGNRLWEFVKEFRTVNDGRTLPVRIGVYDFKQGRVGAAIATDRSKIACDSCGNIFESTVRFFDAKMLKKFEDRTYVFENLDIAMAEGWIKVHYQPIIRTSNGRVCNEEALVRWTDPEKGNFAPRKIISILNEAKIAYKLDLFVLDEVLKKLKRQSEEGLYVVPNSINLSGTDFYSCDIVEEIRKRVDDSGVDRGNIVIEITESVILDDKDYMMAQIERFRKLGFSVWLDDFGKANSSTNILQQIHFDVIKLDETFISKIENNERSKIIITELVRLASGLGSETVAEGVETVEQAEFLDEIGCTRLQGYYFCDVVTIEQIFRRYKEGKQIGFENPKESEYYSALGKVNLYDMSFSLYGDDEKLGSYFNTMPMFIIEVSDDGTKLARGNKSFRDYTNIHHPGMLSKRFITKAEINGNIGSDFLNAMEQCSRDGKPTIVDVREKDKGVAHLFIRRIAINPESGVVALAVVILSYIDNDLELKHKEALERIEQERKTYSRITALSGNYICVYTVDPVTDHFVQVVLDNRFNEVGLSGEGDAFYDQVIERGSKVVYVEDKSMFISSFTKENILDEIEGKGAFVLRIRMMFDGEPRFTCIRAAKIEEKDGPQIIVGIINEHEQVKKEMEYARKLNAARSIANIDALTGVKNKHAYIEAEEQLDDRLRNNEDLEFALVVFDLNGLKEINDNFGHQAGDRYIKEGCSQICKIFQHSPVYRIGGDEFVVIATNHDYHNLDALSANFSALNEKNMEYGGVVIAMGAARYNGENKVSEVFKKADDLMYENKKYLKESE